MSVKFLHCSHASRRPENLATDKPTIFPASSHDPSTFTLYTLHEVFHVGENPTRGCCNTLDTLSFCAFGSDRQDVNKRLKRILLKIRIVLVDAYLFLSGGHKAPHLF